MEFINRLSRANDLQTILRDLTSDIKETYDLGILFLSQQNTDSIKSIAENYQKTENKNECQHTLDTCS